MRLTPLTLSSVGALTLGCALQSSAPVLNSTQEGASAAGQFLFPGEYESHEAMWLSWPTYENKAGFSATEAQLAMIRALKDKVQVNLVVNPDTDAEGNPTPAEQTEAGAREILEKTGTPHAHVRFFQVPHGDIWIRDMGPQFVRNPRGTLRIADWGFNAWGHESHESEYSKLEEAVDRIIAGKLGVATILPSTRNGTKMIHEGGGVTHNGHGTMVAIESVTMQRQLGPDGFCGGERPTADADSPTTYGFHPGWKECKKLVEQEYARVLGVKKILWVPAGVIEDDGTYRGPLASHIKVSGISTKRLKEGLESSPRVDPETGLGLTQDDRNLDEVAESIPHAGVYPIFTTNGHSDEFLRFVNEDTVLLAETEEPAPLAANASDIERLEHWLESENHKRLERAYEALARETTADGKPLHILRMPTPKFMFDVYREGDGMYDYYKSYTGWWDGMTPEKFPDRMFIVLPASYVNFFPSNDVVLVPQFYNPRRSDRSDPAMKRKDQEALETLRKAFPGRTIAPIWNENVNRGGGGVNCITQQQPASAEFVKACPWMKVKVDRRSTPLFASAFGKTELGSVSRILDGRTLYLSRESSVAGRYEVKVQGASEPLSGWVNASDVESAGERCLSLIPR